MSKAKECWLTGMVIMLTTNSAAGLVPFWISVVLFVLAALEFVRGAYYFLTR